MNIKIHRGTHQIGGCITEISTNTTKILIDFGQQLPGLNNETNINTADILTGVDAVFFTHYHGDHVGMFGEIPIAISCFIGAASKEILLTLNKYLVEKLPEKKALFPILEGFKTYTVAKKITVGDITVTPFFVDHSAYDAYVLLIEANGKRILHTGDFRTHGMLGKGVMPMLEKYIRHVDVLICEGTMLSRSKSNLPTEQDLQLAMKKLTQKNVFLLCSSTNIDRIANFYKTRGNRPFVCDEYQKDVLKIVTEHSKGKTNFYNFDKVYTYKSDNEKLHEYIMDKGIFALIRNKESFKKLLEKYYNPNNSVIIYSQWLGYLEPENPAFNENLSKFLLPYKYEYLHTSGHATFEAIQSVITLLSPKYVIPIHTENPSAFFDMSDSCVILADNEVFSL